MIAAEDGNFYRHHGIDWEQTGRWPTRVLRRAESGAVPPRSPQQLEKNLFFTTHRNPVRKVLEYTLAPMANWILGKHRVLELYLTVIEWGGRVSCGGGYRVSAQDLFHRRSEVVVAQLAELCEGPDYAKENGRAGLVLGCSDFCFT